MLTSGSARPRIAIFACLVERASAAAIRLGARHQPVGGLMVLVHADTVEAEPVGKLELADIAGVELFADRGIEIGVGQRDPRRVVAVGIAEIQIRIGHEVEKERLHSFDPFTP
ncbi:MAG TPA: hypothetical protein VI010_00305 [Xanthobacteraceae bacterium]